MSWLSWLSWPRSAHWSKNSVAYLGFLRILGFKWGIASIAISWRQGHQAVSDVIQPKTLRNSLLGFQDWNRTLGLHRWQDVSWFFSIKTSRPLVMISCPNWQRVWLGEAWRFVKAVLNAKYQAYFKNQFGKVKWCQLKLCWKSDVSITSKNLRYSFLSELGRVCGMCCAVVVEGWHHAPGTSIGSVIQCRCSSSLSRLEGGSLQTRRRRCKLPQGCKIIWSQNFFHVKSMYAAIEI